MQNYGFLERQRFYTTTLTPNGAIEQSGDRVQLYIDVLYLLINGRNGHEGQ